MKWLLIKIIRGYQLFLSPLLGSRCRYFPSCSSYSLEAINSHGVFKGLSLAARRIGRCHPLSEGGFDPVPPCHCSTHSIKKESST